MRDYIWQMSNDECFSLNGKEVTAFLKGRDSLYFGGLNEPRRNQENNLFLFKLL